MNRALVPSALLLSLTLLAGCQKAEEPAAAAPVELTAPADASDDNAWRQYLGQIIGKNQQDVTDRVFSYYLPANSDVMTPEDEAADKRTKYSRMVDQVNAVVLRTVLPGNMLAFGSPDSTKMADLIVAAFTGAAPDALQGSKVVFIGAAADEARVKAAVEASGAKFVFVEAT